MIKATLMNKMISRLLLAHFCNAALICIWLVPAVMADELIPVQYPLVKVDSGILQKPGTVSWTADGMTLAFFKDSLKLYDVLTGGLREITMPSGSFISSGPQNMLYIIYGEGLDRRVVSLDVNSLEQKEIPVMDQPDAVFALPDSRKLLLISVRIKQKNLWSEFLYKASVLDLKTSKTAIRYEEQTTVAGRMKPSDYQSAWLWPGPRPSETEILAVEYVKAPVVMPYLRMRLLDYVTGKSREIGKIEHVGMSTPVSWSPDGNRFAYADQQGRLGIYQIKESMQSSPAGAGHVPGYYPSWNPKGSQIYFGGHVMNSDGSSAGRIIQDGQNSIGVWSPDGRMLAVTDRGSLYLARDFNAAFIPPDRIYGHELMKKRMLLKELLAEQLITEQEYEERHNNLLNKEE